MTALALDQYAPLSNQDQPEPRRAEHIAPLASGRWVEIADHDATERVTVRAASGEIELTIELTPEGPKLRMKAVELALESRHTTRIACERFEVHAREAVSLTGGKVDLESTRYDVRLKANDDIRANGERVLLNCQEPTEVPAWMKEKLGAKLLDAGGMRPKKETR